MHIGKTRSSIKIPYQGGLGGKLFLYSGGGATGGLQKAGGWE
jgi:hypothetical protein